MAMMPPSEPQGRRRRNKRTGERSLEIASLIEEKHRAYVRAAGFHRWLYYGSRLVAGMSAALLPFLVTANPSLATTLSIAIAVTVVVDTVFNPKSKWQLYSRATDLLTIAQAKADGTYNEKNREALQILLQTEERALLDLHELDALIHPPQSSRSGEQQANGNDRG